MSIFKDKNFKDDKYIDKDGYVMMKMPEEEKPLYQPMYSARGYAFEHRIKMAKKLGRPLKRNEVVHHIDKNRRNNDISNLELHLRKYHNLQHKNKGDYKLFSKDYQPRWQNRLKAQQKMASETTIYNPFYLEMRKEAMKQGIQRTLATLGGATLGNIPAYFAYKKSIKLDNPEEVKGAKRKAIKQALLGTLVGGYGGYTAGGFLGKPKDQPFHNWREKVKKNKFTDKDLLAGTGVGALAGYLASRQIGDDKPNLKKLLTTGAGTTVGAGLGLINLVTR